MSGARVPVPVNLVLDRRVSAQARVLYAVLQVCCSDGSEGEFTYPHLSRLTGGSPNTLKRAVSELVNSDWLRVGRAHRLSPVRFTLHNPVAAHSEAEAIRARQRVEAARHRGEALMREFLSLLIESDDYADDVAPGFLVNPATDQLLQFDRFYPPNVAFEFNGPQHYRPTDRFPSEVDAARQEMRDLIKIGHCVRKGITLVVVHPEDLDLKIMQQKIGGLLPLRALSGHEPLVAFLKAAGRAYQRAAKRGQASKNEHDACR